MSSPLHTALKACLPETHFLIGNTACKPYGRDQSDFEGTPAAVAFPRHHADVVALVQLACEFNLSITPRGAGTGKPGGAVPDNGSLVIAFERMNRILEIDPINRWVHVETGLINGHLEAALQPHGLFWPPNPGNAHTCLIGGNLAYNAAGPRSLKYGTPRDNTLKLRGVTAEGHTFETGTHTRKGVVGYDLTRLLIGSEGTLALLTEATLALHPVPEATATFKIFYPGRRLAADAVATLMQTSITPTALELLDSHCLTLLRPHDASIPKAAEALLLLKLDGLQKTLPHLSEHLLKIIETTKPCEVQTAHTPEEEQVLWQTRASLSPVLRAHAPFKVSDDVVVPWSQLSHFMTQLDVLSERHTVPIAAYGHAGDGNLHVNFLLKTLEERHSTAFQTAFLDVMQLTLALGGTLSGEHGVGLEKRELVSQELDHTALFLMHTLKASWDSKNRLNPGKALPPLTQKWDAQKG